LKIKENQLDSLNQSIENLSDENNSYLNQITKSKKRNIEYKNPKRSWIKINLKRM